MFCKFCGKKIPDTSTTCPSCGKQLNEAKQVITQQQIIGVQLPKNLGLGIALSFLFGPLGLLYSSVRYACILTAIDVFLLMFLIGIGSAGQSNEFLMVLGMGIVWFLIFGTWIGSMVLSWHAISTYNDNVRKGKMNRDID